MEGQLEAGRCAEEDVPAEGLGETLLQEGVWGSQGHHQRGNLHQ